MSTEFADDDVLNSFSNATGSKTNTESYTSSALLEHIARVQYKYDEK